MNTVGVLSLWSLAAAAGTALVFVSGSANVGDAQQSGFPLNAGDMASDQRAADAGGIGEQYRDSLEQQENDEGGSGRFFANRELDGEMDTKASIVDSTHEGDESVSLKEERTHNNTNGLGSMDLSLPRSELSPVSTNAPTETEERTEEMERDSHESLVPSVVEEANQHETDKTNLDESDDTLHAAVQEDSSSVFMNEEDDMLDYDESASQRRGLALLGGLGGGGKRKKSKYPPIPVKTHPALVVPPPLEKVSFPSSMSSPSRPCKHPQPIPNKSSMRGIEASDPPFLHPSMEKSATKADFYNSQQHSSFSPSKGKQGYKNTSLSSSGGHLPQKEGKYTKTIPHKSQMYEGSKEKNYSSSFSSSYPSSSSSPFYGGGKGGKDKNFPSNSKGFYPPPSYSRDEDLPYHQGLGSSSSFDPSDFHPSSSFSSVHTMRNEYEPNFLSSSSGIGKDENSSYHGSNPPLVHQGYEMGHERNSSPSSSSSSDHYHPDQHSYEDHDPFHQSFYHGEASQTFSPSYSKYTPPSIPQKVY